MVMFESIGYDCGGHVGSRILEQMSPQPLLWARKYIGKPTFLFGVLGRLGSVRVFLFDVGVSAFRLQRAYSAPGEDRGGHGLFVLYTEPRLGRFDSGHDV